MRIDLHVHSNNSDGMFPPAEVARIAREAGLGAIALSDHDSVAGVDEARRAGSAIGLEVVTGVELSASLDGRPVHVLGYFIDAENKKLVEEMALIRDDRIHRAQGMVNKLNALGVPMRWERVRELAAGESVGRPHVAQAMVEAGVIAKTPDAFTPKWIGDGGRAYVPKKALTPQGAVDLIRHAGGVAVLAHAVWVREAEMLIRSLAAGGMAGLEVDHPDHDEDARGRFGALALELDLVRTGSSDWHGNEHGGKIGENTTSPKALEALRMRAGR